MDVGLLKRGFRFTASCILKKMFYGRRPSEAWIPIYGFLYIKENILWTSAF